MAPTFEMTIRKDFPDLGDQWVVIRNPRLAPSAKVDLRPVRRDDNGELDLADFGAAVNECAAGLVVDWHVYDMSSLDGKPALIPVEECNAQAIKERIASPIRQWVLDMRTEVATPPPVSQEQTSSTPGSNP